MKYRRLTIEELKELEPEFVRFLASNTVTADEWETLKVSAPEKAERLIELFSDIVFEKVIEKVEYLEHRSPTDLRLFHCGPDKIKLLGIRATGIDGFDFAAHPTAEEMMQQVQQAPAGSLKMYSAEKGYKAGNRNQELFKMMQEGCLIADGQLYKTLAALRQ